MQPTSVDGSVSVFYMVSESMNLVLLKEPSKSLITKDQPHEFMLLIYFVVCC